MSSAAGPAALHCGFTLLELLVALTILAMAFAVIWSTFTAAVTAWQRGGELLDNLRHGDFVAEQLVSALRSTAYFTTAPDRYGFRLESKTLQYPADRISWVTTSDAFMPPESPYRGSIHRIIFSVENNDSGDPAVAIRALPVMMDEEKLNDPPWFVSSEVKGFKCRVYDFEKESWGTEWEDTNSVPSLVELTFFMEPLEPYGPPVTMQRLVVIPVAPPGTNAVRMSEGGGDDETGGGR